MYGTVGRFRVKPGKMDDALGLFDEWERDLRPRIDGAIGGVTYRLDGDQNTLISCAIFENKDKYFANADNADQDKWFQRLRECLDADPEWNDGEIVRSMGNLS